MAWNRYRPSRRAVFAVLMVASAAALLLPAGWTDPLKHVVQLLVPAQHAVDHLGRQASASIADLDDDPVVRRLEREKQALMDARISQDALIDQLQTDLRKLSALRRDNYIPRSTPLLHANVVGRDIVALRDVVLLSRGSTRRVGRQDWVASRFFVDQGRTSGLSVGQAVLARETLVGRVELVSPYMSRVQLFSDVDARPIEVRIGNLADNKLETVEYVCSLHGRGAGEMVIPDVPYGALHTEDASEWGATGRRIRPGDFVYTAPAQLGVPVPMVIGRVDHFEVNPKNRLVYDVIVKPIAAADALDDVYVIPVVPVGPMLLTGE